MSEHTPDKRSAPVASADATAPLPTDQSPEDLRRGFLKRFGKYAIATPVVTFTLMSSRTSKAVGSLTD